MLVAQERIGELPEIGVRFWVKRRSEQVFLADAQPLQQVFLADIGKFATGGDGVQKSGTP